MKQFFPGILLLLSATATHAQNITWARPAAPAGQDVYTVAFSEDGSRIFAGTECTPAYLRIFETNTANLLWDHEMIAGHLCVSGVQFSTDGKRAAAMEEMGNLLIYDYSGATPTLLKTIVTGTNYAFGLDFSPDGSKVVTGCGDKKMIIYNFADGSVANTVQAHNNWVQAVDWSATDKIASGGDDNMVKLWDNGGNLLHTLTGHSGAVLTVRFSKDGQYLASAGKDKTIKLWDVASGNLLRTFTGHTGEIKQVDISDDGKRIVSGSMDGTTRLWNLETGAEISSFKKEGAGTIYSVDFSPSGQFVAAGAASGDVQLWDMTFPTAVNSVTDEVLQVYPNPVADKLYIKSKTPVSVNIKDAAGRVLYTVSDRNNVEVITAQFAAGNYFVSIISNGEERTYVVVKE